MNESELFRSASTPEMAPIIEAMRKVASGVVNSVSIPVSHLVATSDDRANLKIRVLILSGLLKVDAHVVVKKGRPWTGKVAVKRRPQENAGSRLRRRE